MLTWEYDQEAEYRVIREESWEEGRVEGREEGKAEAIRKITELVNSGLTFNEALQMLGSETSQMA